VSTTALDSLRGVRITREHVEVCTAEHQEGPKPGCPMCFLRAEYAILEVFKVQPRVVLQALERAAGRIKEQILQQQAKGEPERKTPCTRFLASHEGESPTHPGYCRRCGHPLNVVNH
jgi:hypothetical protein